MFVTMAGLGLQEEGVTAPMAWLVVGGLYLAGPVVAIYRLVRGESPQVKPWFRWMDPSYPDDVAQVAEFEERRRKMDPSQPGSPAWIADEDRRLREMLDRMSRLHKET
jgi:hypothetical protein